MVNFNYSCFIALFTHQYHCVLYCCLPTNIIVFYIVVYPPISCFILLFTHQYHVLYCCLPTNINDKVTLSRRCSFCLFFSIINNISVYYHNFHIIICSFDGIFIVIYFSVHCNYIHTPKVSLHCIIISTSIIMYYIIILLS